MEKKANKSANVKEKPNPSLSITVSRHYGIWMYQF